MKAPKVFEYFEKIDLTPFKELITEVKQLKDNLDFPKFPSSWWQSFLDLPEQGPYFTLVNNEFYMITDGYEDQPQEIVIEGNKSYRVISNTSNNKTFFAYVEGGQVTLKGKVYNIGGKALVKILPAQVYIFEDAEIHAWYEEEPVIEYKFKLPWKYIRVLTSGWEQSIITNLDGNDVHGVFWARNQRVVDSSELTPQSIGYQLLGTGSKSVWTFFDHEVYIRDAILPDGDTAPSFVYGIAKVDEKMAGEIKQKSIVPLRDMKNFSVSDAKQFRKSFQLSLEDGGAGNIHLVEIDMNSNQATLEVSGDTTIYGYYIFTINRVPQECTTLDELRYVDAVIGNKPFYSTFEFASADAKLNFERNYDSTNSTTTFTIKITPSKQYENLYAIIWTSCPYTSDSNSTFNVDTTGSLQTVIFSIKDVNNAVFIDTARVFCSESVRLYAYDTRELGNISIPLEVNAEAALKISETEVEVGSNIKVPSEFTIDANGTTYTSDGEIITISEDSYTVNVPDNYKAVVFMPAEVRILIRPGDIVTDLGTPLYYERKM